MKQNFVNNDMSQSRVLHELDFVKQGRAKANKNNTKTRYLFQTRLSELWDT